MIACENSGHDITYDFPEVRKIVKAGATEKSVVDYELTRYACFAQIEKEQMQILKKKAKEGTLMLDE